jgi:GTP-binding protein
MTTHAPLPIVAIVGRPNVGKSRLFNRYAGHARALVRDEPGVTRDRIAEEIEVSQRRILLVDTAGLDRGREGDLSLQIQAQARTAVEQADAILLLVDGQVGLLPEDEMIAKTLRRTRKPVALAVNKIDVPDHADRINEFYRLGLDPMQGVSAEHGGGAFEILEALVDALPSAPEIGDGDGEGGDRDFIGVPEGEIPDYSEHSLDGDFGTDEELAGDAADAAQTPTEEPEAPLRVAVVGRPNVGKSSLVNRLLGEERVVVSDMPGTTRDSVDISLEVDGQAFVLVDTAGLRRPGRRDQSIERASALMTVRSLEKAEIALLLVDAEEGIVDQDAHVASLVRDRGLAALVLANKWDRVDAEHTDRILEDIHQGLRFMSDVPVLPISAKTGARVPRLFPAIGRVAQQANLRISTPELNRWLQETVRRHEPALAKRAHQVRRRMKFFYAVQTGVRPPTFTIFCTHPDGIQTAYRRYLENRLRERFGFKGTAIRLRLRSRGRS